MSGENFGPLGSAFVALVAQFDQSSFRSAMDDMAQSAKAGADQVQRSLSGIRESADSLAAAAGRMGLALSAAVTAPLVGLASVGIGFNSMRANAQVAFETLLGSGEKAKVFLDDLQKLANSTPFEFPGLVKGSQRLLAAGFSADSILPSMVAIGDAVAGMGRGTVEIERVTNALAQMKAKGKVSAEEVTQQLGEIVPAWQFIADKLNISVAEAQRRAQAGLLDVDATIGAILEGMERKFSGSMEKMSRRWDGLLSTLRDTSRVILGDLLEGTFVKLQAGLQLVVDKLPALQTWVHNLSPELKDAALAVGAVFAAAGPAALGVAGLSAAFAFLTTQAGLATLAIATFAAALVVFPKFRGVVADVLRDVVGLVGVLISQLGIAARTIENLATGHWREAWKSMSRDFVTSAGDALIRTLDQYDAAVNSGTSLTQDFNKALDDVQRVLNTHKTNVDAVTGSTKKSEAEFKKNVAALAEYREAWNKAAEDFKNRTFAGGESVAEGLRENQRIVAAIIADYRDLLAIEQKAGDEFIKNQQFWNSELQRIRNESGKGGPAAEDVKAGEAEADRQAKVIIDRQKSIRKAAEDEAKKWRQAWSTAVGQVTHDFAKAMTDMLFESKKFALDLKAIFKDLAESILQILITGIFQKALKKLGDILVGEKGKGGVLGGIAGALGGLLGGGEKAAGAAASAGAAGAAGAGGAAAGTGAGGSGAGASLAAFASNPITIAVAASIAAGLVAKHFIGLGRRTANEWTQGPQREFENALSGLVGTFDRQRAAGTLTLDDAKKAREALQSLWTNYRASGEAFAAQGKNQNKVWEQNLAQLRHDFGPGLSHVFDGMEASIANLQTGKSASGAPLPGGSGLQSTGLTNSASRIFASGVDKMVLAIEKLLKVLADLPSAQMIPAAQTTEAIPSLASGGVIQSSGLIFGHTNEVVQPLRDLKSLIAGFVQVPQTRSELWSQVFYANTPRLEQAHAGASDAPVNLTLTQNLEFHYDGELSVDQIRSTLMPQIIATLETGVRGYRERLSRIVKGDLKGIVTQ